jgi:Predicted P-loop-containing kinase
MTISQSTELLIVTGMSGAGRSTVANTLEDQGWYVVDNLPPQMLPPIADLLKKDKSPSGKLAVVIDVRGGDFFDELSKNIQNLQEAGIQLRIVFLEASDQSLVRRFEQVRRPHPLQGDGGLLEGIAKERSKLTELREAADVVIDSSDLNVHQLGTRILEEFGEDANQLQVQVQSFGFKYGTPSDADMIFDARFLPNPHWDESLRELTGNHSKVQNAVMSSDLAQNFISNMKKMLESVFAGYRTENKRFITIAIGCTGGKHRSVTLANQLADMLSGEELRVRVNHRDLGRE